MSNTPKIVPGVEETVALLEVACISNRWASSSWPSSFSLSLSHYCHHLSAEKGIKLKAAQPNNHQQPTSQLTTNNNQPNNHQPKLIFEGGPTNQQPAGFPVFSPPLVAFHPHQGAFVTITIEFIPGLVFWCAI